MSKAKIPKRLPTFADFLNFLSPKNKMSALTKMTNIYLRINNKTLITAISQKL